MTTQEMIAVMQAAVDGKQLQVRELYKGSWEDCVNPSWSWGDFEYRVKPEHREWWAVYDGAGGFYAAFRTEPQAAGFVQTLNRDLEIIHVREVLQ